jgi:hypothetical protein
MSLRICKSVMNVVYFYDHDDGDDGEDNTSHRVQRREPRSAFVSGGRDSDKSVHQDAR